MVSAKFNVFKMYMWFMELVQFPLLVNIANMGVCRFTTSKASIRPVKCYSEESMFAEWADEVE